MIFQNTLDFARSLDAQDPLRRYRERFFFPKHDGADVLYFCGNSLGLQPRSVRPALLAELDHWAEHGVEGHFRGEMPWLHYHKFLTEQAARLVGALPHEAVVMNTLTVNLHLMMVSFYRPDRQRFKIVMEGGAFPSDQYAVESQVRSHGFDPATAIVEVVPRPGEDVLRTEDILEVIEREGDSVALVMFGGVNYYTGQFYDLEKITAAAHRVGARAGFDLAHAAGNLPLRLHDWGADFAVWCSYKYLNSGPGGPAGAFVHERHADNPDLPRFAGWWGHDEGERFQMRKGFRPMHGAAGWQLSNAQIFAFAAHKASLDIFHEAGMDALRAKSLTLTAYLQFVLDEANTPSFAEASAGKPSTEKASAGETGSRFRTITPRDPAQRGCQISVLTDDGGRDLYQRLTQQGVVADWREPNVVRLAPVPLYNSFEDVWRLGQLIG